MKYNNIKTGIFISRPNRFIAYVLLEKEIVVVHVKNTGRCKELLIEGCKVFICESDNKERKTKYDLICVEKILENGEKILINIDSSAPNSVAYEWLPLSGLFSENSIIKREVTYGNSRFDIHVEDCDRKSFIEVKGVTLEENGTAMFPDAPTKRGIKHLNELVSCKKDGFEAYILFVIQMKGPHLFTPNDKTHKAFGDALRNAANSGVKILAYDSKITADTITIDKKVKIKL